MAELVEIRGLRGLKDKVDKISDSIFSKRLMSEIGIFAQTAIKTRTLTGKDADGADFAPYTPKYAVFRKLKGRPINKVDLDFTGSMLASMDIDPTENQLDIFFQNTEDEFGGKNPIKAFFLNQKRNFFALSNDDINTIMKIVEQYYKRLIES